MGRLVRARRRGVLAEVLVSGVVWTSEYRTPEGEVMFRVGRAGVELVAEWPGIARLFAQADGRSHRWELEPDVDDETLEKIQRGIGRGLLRHLEGRLSLHAAAASRNGRAVACIGDSGRGKSTLVADLCQNHGAALLADDVAGIEIDGDEVLVLPGERVHWMGPSSLRALGHRLEREYAGDDDKACVAPRVLAIAPVRLSALVFLVFDDGIPSPLLAPLRGLDAVERLVPCLARFVVDDARAQLREIEQLKTLSSRVPLLELRRPRSLARHHESAAALLPLFEESP
jgi:hypothetical protein